MHKRGQISLLQQIWLGISDETRASKNDNSVKQHGVNAAEVEHLYSRNLDSETNGLRVCHMLTANADRHNSWIVDYGATCHVCNDRSPLC